MDQKVKYINIKDLVLWTENPRDPIDENAEDQDIVDRALEDGAQKWSLSKLAKEMGDYYDFSELPTVVYHKNKPVVYDGNRRIVIGKIKYGLVKVKGDHNIKIPDFPEEIPCNVCAKKIALTNVYRKHSDTGSWQPLERDIFVHKFMGEAKSKFLVIEEETGIISLNPHLNQRFVRDEIFKEEILRKIGFTIKNGSLYSVHNTNEGYIILNDISKKVENKEITTRKNRGKVIEILEPSSQELIDKNKANKPKLSGITFGNKKDSKIKSTKVKRTTQRTSKRENELFGGSLYLKMGDVSNLYRDIVDLYKFYTKEKKKLSQTFPSIIRMSLRLLCETAAKDCNNMKLDNFLKKYFKVAKGKLGKDEKTTLSNLNVTETSIVQLLHTGAHNYTSSKNVEHTLALSLIIGEILTETHGKDN